MTKKLYNYKGVKVYLEKTEYRNNNTVAVLMYTGDGELYGCVTVNLNSPMQSDSMAYLDENNMPGIGVWLEKNGLALPMGVVQRSGFCSYPLFNIIL